MKFGVREICDVVLKAKANQKVGNKIFYKNEPVIYFDTLKTSSMEGAATTVYAQGGRGNSRLVAWEGERTVTFTMEDALISPAGFMILSGAGLTEASTNQTIKVHTTEQTNAVYVDGTTVNIKLAEKPYTKAGEDFIYVMLISMVQTKHYEKSSVFLGRFSDGTLLPLPVQFDDGVIFHSAASFLSVQTQKGKKGFAEFKKIPWRFEAPWDF